MFPFFRFFFSKSTWDVPNPPPVPARSHRISGRRPRWWVPGIQGWDRTWRSNRSTRCRQRHCLRHFLDEKNGGWEVEATSEILEWFIAGKNQWYMVKMEAQLRKMGDLELIYERACQERLESKLW
jgi:hypothetical protein